jgi:serine/threonine-protein kinase
MHHAGRATEGSIGGYRLAGLIGKGAVGEVHVAIAPGGGEAVALKLLQLGDGSVGDRAEARRRFLAEAGAAQRLQHPGIVRVLAAGDEGGVAWMAMELLTGCDLVRYTRAARLLPEAVVLGVAERVARALAYAHEAGVVHRDIKPANVVVDWAADRVTITDFGIARLADGERTRTGLVLGSPAYMAPELLAGGGADARSDLYALGVTMFQLLAGRLPHDHPSMGELLRQVVSEPAPDLRGLRPELPAPLTTLVAALLGKRPDTRPPNAAALAETLLRLRQDLETPPQPVASGPKSRA